jgi:hypothetical protein
MRHVDEETLAMIALGEDVGSADVVAHLAQCSECAHELSQLRHLVSVGQELTTDDVPTPPPAFVWDRISAELGLAGAPTRPGIGNPRDGRHNGAGTAGSPVSPGGTAPPAAAAPPADTSATVHDLAARRRPRTAGWLAVAASVGVIAGSLGGAWWASNRQATPDATVLAQAALEPLPGWEATGVALVERVAQDSDSRVVVVQVSGELGTDGYREVWLLAPDLSGMVSLGLLTGSSGEFVIPDGLDLTRYSVVDVSEEPFDGDAAHSGNSIVRGPLEA